MSEICSQYCLCSNLIVRDMHMLKNGYAQSQVKSCRNLQKYLLVEKGNIVLRIRYFPFPGIYKKLENKIK